MLYGLPEYAAQPFAQLPDALHYRGEPTAWVRMTRPGMRLHSFLEGLTIADDGSLYLADVPYGRIFRVSADGLRSSLVTVYDGEPHGLCWQPSGHLLLTDYRHGLGRLDRTTGAIEILAKDDYGRPFLGLSDLTVDTDGNIWFTDSGRSSLSNPVGRLYVRSADGRRLRCVLEGIPYPNGVAITADGAHVLIAATRANAVWKLQRPTGPANTPATAPGPPMLGVYQQLSGGLGPDGLAVGPRGMLAVAHAQAGCVWLFDALGFPLARITTPCGLWTTSVRFSTTRDDDAHAHGHARLYIVDAQSASILAFDLSLLDALKP